MNMYTVRFEDGTEGDATAASNWYPRPMGVTMVEDAEKDAGLFMTEGCVHPRHLAHGRMFSRAEYYALQESVEVIGLRVMTL